MPTQRYVPTVHGAAYQSAVGMVCGHAIQRRGVLSDKEVNREAAAGSVRQRQAAAG